MADLNCYAASGIPGLDRVLRGGFQSGNTYLIHGASGTGKTTLSLQFLMEGVREGQTCLYIGTSETDRELRSIAGSHGWTLEGITLHHHTTPQPGVQQTMLHPAEVELPHTVDSLLTRIDEVEPDRLVIDSLAEIRVLARDMFWYRRQLMLLKQHFAERQCTVLLVELPYPEQQMINTIVSGVIELEQIPPHYGPDRRRLRVTKMRGQDFSSGYHDYRICSGGLDVCPRLTAAEHRRRFDYERASTGIASIDAMLQGGLVRGTSTLLLGPSGTGKSALATQLVAAAAARGERSAFFAFDERVQTLFQRAHGIGVPLQQYADEGSIRIQQIDPAELTSGEFSELVKCLVERENIRWLVIDSLNGYAYAMPEKRALILYLHELSSYLSQQGVSSVYTLTQHGLLTVQREQPVDVSYISDAVLLFRHFEYAGRVRKAMSVYKSRSSGHESSIRELIIDAGGLHVGEPLTRFQGILSGTPLYLGDAPDA